MKGKFLSHVQLLATRWTAAHQSPRPCDSPGKSIGVACHCLLRAIKPVTEMIKFRLKQELGSPVIEVQIKLVDNILKSQDTKATNEEKIIVITNRMKSLTRVSCFSQETAKFLVKSLSRV